MSVLKLTLAVEHYDRHLPLLEGLVQPEGIELQAKEVGQTTGAGGRHERMLQHQEFDAAEVSMSSYIMGRARGLPLIAIPVFPRRLFSQSSMYCYSGAGLKRPQDLAGKRVGLSTYQTTMSVLAKGDLQHEYGVATSSVTWVTNRAELFPFETPAGVTIQPAPSGRSVEDLLAEGAIDALIMPRVPRPLAEGSPRVGRLFPDARAEEARYFQRVGYYPIMHTIALKESLLKQHPWVAASLFHAFEQAKQVCYRRYDDPNWSMLAWARLLQEEERRIFGPDPWPNGLSSNRRNLERLVQYSWEQGLIPHPMPVDELFAESTRGL